MAVEDLFKGNNVATSLAIGIGAAVVAPLVIAGVSTLSRPLGRAAMKSGALLYEKGRETAAEFGEVMDDFVAEIKAEAAERQRTEQVDDQTREVAEAVGQAVAEAEASQSIKTTQGTQGSE